jgi:dephospho-CoA kinase
MRSVGLTGGIGAGKSTVAKLLAAKGAVVVDADRIARELQQPGTRVFAAIVDEFGDGILAADGTLDRAGLAAIVFADPERLQRLNEIVHPAIDAEIRRRVRARIRSDDIVVLDIPLLSPAAAYPLSGIIVVDVPIEIAVDRLVRLRAMDELDARRRIERQIGRDERRAMADVIIDNSGDEKLLAREVDRVWSWIATLPAMDPDDPRLDGGPRDQASPAR